MPRPNVGGAEKIKAVVLAAGYATRLYPLTRNIPKPLLQVTSHKTVIDFIGDDLSADGRVDEITVVTNHKYFGDFSAWARRRRTRVPVHVLDDGTLSNADRRGAIGDMAFAVKHRKIDGDLVVVGGDNLFDVGVSRFLDFAQARRPRVSLGLFDVHDRVAARRFGIVGLDRLKRVVSFEEKPARPKSTLAATCLYYFPKESLAHLKTYIRDRDTSNDAPGNYIKWLMKKTGVSGFAIRGGHWFDIGHMESYKEVLALYNGKI
jgi:glucose-1-phosphate thymidylyltransferase